MGWRWATPRKDMEPVEVLWDGYGVTPPQVWNDKQTENATFKNSNNTTLMLNKEVEPNHYLLFLSVASFHK